LKRWQGSAVHAVQVRPAVVIEINYAQASQNSFDLILPPTRIVAQYEIEAASRSNIFHTDRARRDGLSMEKSPREPQPASGEPDKIPPCHKVGVRGAHSGPDEKSAGTHPRVRVPWQKRAPHLRCGPFCAVPFPADNAGFPSDRDIRPRAPGQDFAELRPWRPFERK